ncbi:hypothetical protein SDC9_156326 [bioreactor metagenome]|uniref:Uncharacterized protein n=1 Tax=bioreactor metagenome TaxID=1076179 RepID=A0A645F3W2_9ZZZZ
MKLKHLSKEKVLAVFNVKSLRLKKKIYSIEKVTLLARVTFLYVFIDI